MPTRLLLDGEDLPSLMLRVKAEMGPDARIVKAERIRTGGIAGFFAREHFELTVEVPETRRPHHPRLRPPEGTGYVVPGDAAGIEALLAAADAAERSGLHGDGAGTGATTWGPGAAAAAQVSTSGDTFARVLQSMREIVGPLPEAAPPSSPEAGNADADAGDTGDGIGSGTAAADPAAEDVTTDTAPEGGGAEATVSADEDRAAADASAHADRPGSSVSTLLELGIPTRLLLGFTDLHASVPLSVLVRSFEPAPRLRLARGTVVAVVGEPGDALRTATQMAHRANMEAAEIVLAGDIGPVPGHGRRLQTPVSVARFRSRLTGDKPTLVVIGVDPARDRWEESATLLDALDPDHAWAVLDARAKPVELRRWLRGVGARRPFDAIAAVRTFDAQAPGTVLNLGTPVGWVDGLPASPVVWASVLSERLADDVRWD